MVHHQTDINIVCSAIDILTFIFSKADRKMALLMVWEWPLSLIMLFFVVNVIKKHFKDKFNDKNAFYLSKCYTKYCERH